QRALLVGQLPRYGDVHEHAVIASAETLEYGHPAAAEDADLTRLGAGLEVELDITLERRDRDPGTECGLRHREIDGRVGVVCFTHESRMRPDADEDVEVTGLPAEQARVALAGEPDALAVVDPRRNLDLERALLEQAALAPTAGAGILDDAARTTATGAGLAADELAERRSRDMLDAAGAAAFGTGRRRLAGLDPVAAALVAEERHLDRHASLDSGRRF